MTIDYVLLGKAAVAITALVAVTASVVFLFAAVSFRRRRIMFPKIILFLLDILYAPAKIISRTFFIRDTLVDEILIELRNAVNRESFRKTRGKKVLIGPHCMRSPKCRSSCNPRTGYVCTGCGLCKYAKIKKMCEHAGYLLFIVPGDSFVRKIVAYHRPKKAIGIACFEELNDSMHALTPFMPVQGVPLLRGGCYKTDVDLDKVQEILEDGKDV